MRAMDEWLKPSTVLPAVVIVGGIFAWAYTNSGKIDQTTSLVTTLDRRLERIETKLENLPALVERVGQIDRQLAEGRGTWATMDGRLRAIESNAAANHADIDSLKPNPRRTP